MKNKLLIFIGAVIVILSVVFCIGLLISITHTSGSRLGNIFLFIFFGFLYTIGLGMINVSHEEDLKEDFEKKEKQALKIIKSKEGQVKPIDIAIASEFTLEESKSFLNNLVDGGQGSTKATVEGELIYIFNHF